MDSSKGSGKANEEGGAEVKVETVDYRIPAGRDQAEPDKQTVEVTHVIHEGEKPGTGNVVAGAAGKVTGAVQSAKEAVSEEKKNE